MTSLIKKQLGEGYKNLDDVLAPYITALENKDDDIRIKGKTIQQACREQPSLLAYYDERKVELYTYVRFFEKEIKRIRSNLYKSYLENYSRDLTDRSIEKYIDGEKAYLHVKEKYDGVLELYQVYDSIVETFKNRGYSLNNITKIYTSALQDTVL